MGNEYSFHHNYPATYEDVIGVGAVHPDTSGLPYPLFFPTNWVTRAIYSGNWAALTQEGATRSRCPP